MPVLSGLVVHGDIAWKLTMAKELLSFRGGKTIYLVGSSLLLAFAPDIRLRV